jgi:16S rRNA (adenine(1408)-N(1))-methyltransferase
MLIQIGKRVESITHDEFRARVRSYDSVLIDVGTGDGQFVCRTAAEQATTLCVGLDPVGANMTTSSARVTKKPARGGLRNILFVIASVEDFPPELAGTADKITINFPWGSLLRVLIEPNEAVLAQLANLGRPGTEILILLNYSVLQDESYLKRLGMPVVSAETLHESLRAAYQRASIDLTDVHVQGGDVPHRTSWGQHLTRNSHREVLVLRGRLT